MRDVTVIVKDLRRIQGAIDRIDQLRLAQASREIALVDKHARLLEERGDLRQELDGAIFGWPS